MGMATLFRALALLFCLLVPTLEHTLLSCENTSSNASGYRCQANGSQDQCRTFAILSTNSHFSSLSNLSFYLGLNRFSIAQANGFSVDTELLPKDLPLFIPIDCKCNGSFFQAQLIKTTTTKGETFYSIAESLEGLTTCKAIKEKNFGVSPWNLGDKGKILVPLRCSCPSSSTPTTRFLLTYPVNKGDTISNLAIKFNTTSQAIVSENNRALSDFTPQNLQPFTSILIPINTEPNSLAKPRVPNSGFPQSRIPVISPHKKKSKMWLIGIYIAVTGVVVGASIAIVAAFLIIQLKKKKKQQSSSKDGDPELQQLSLSVRTMSEKKVSFEGSQDTHESWIIETTPRKVLIEKFTVEELKKATEDFSSNNLIDGDVYHGRLSGKSLAIKRTKPEIISKIEYWLFHNANHHHPNIIRPLGACLSDGSDSYLVFEFAKNGCLKDWLHGGLAMKSQFIASCYCFLTWDQRLKICLDVAVALQYMHQIMTPSYVHRNVKSRNIFLDEDFNAKIGNFGMARCVEGENQDTELNSSNPASWSNGYLAPEYIHQGLISPSIDIFAFGVVLLEILTGKTPITRPDNKGEGSVWLCERIKSTVLSENSNELRDWMDNALGENYSLDAAVALANLAKSCVDEDPSLRPNAGEIVQKLASLVVESAEGEQMLISESSSKPLVCL